MTSGDIATIIAASFGPLVALLTWRLARRQTVIETRQKAEDQRLDQIVAERRQLMDERGQLADEVAALRSEVTRIAAETARCHRDREADRERWESERRQLRWRLEHIEEAIRRWVIDGSLSSALTDELEQRLDHGPGMHPG